MEAQAQDALERLQRPSSARTTATSARPGSGRRSRWRRRRSLSSSRPNLEAKAAAEVPRAPVSREEGAAAQPSTPIVTAKSSRRPPVEGKGKAAQPSTLREAERVPAPPPANDDRKPTIVTARRRGKRFADVPEMTPEEYRRRRGRRRHVA